MAKELPIPQAAVSDPKSLEMIRVWIAGGKQHCVLNIGFWEVRGTDERDAWGILLADMLHHIADAHEKEYGRDPAESLARIREAFEAEMDAATSPRIGQFVEPKKDGTGKE